MKLFYSFHLTNLLELTEVSKFFLEMFFFCKKKNTEEGSKNLN